MKKLTPKQKNILKRVLAILIFFAPIFTLALFREFIEEWLFHFIMTFGIGTTYTSIIMFQSTAPLKEISFNIHVLPYPFNKVDGKLPKHVLRADDEFYIERVPLNIGFISGVLLAALFNLSYVGLNHGQVSEPLSRIYFAAVCIIGVVIYLLSPRKVFIFDRMNGTVTIPYSLGSRKVTIPFSEMHVDMAFHPSLHAIHPILKTPIALNPPGPPGSETDHELEYFRQEWSFYLLYMDKNRPLPIGTVFSPYREKDYERRKAEGFPKPIFYSDIAFLNKYRFEIRYPLVEWRKVMNKRDREILKEDKRLKIFYKTR